jgi:hypothetical protein
MSTTPPPNLSLVLPQGTPVHTRSSATGKFNLGYENRVDALSCLADKMRPFCVGPMGTQDFLTHFLPEPPNSSDFPQFRVGMFKNLISKLSETEPNWYNVFVSSDSDPRRPPHCS